MEKNQTSEKKTVYESFYGGKGYSIVGPLFYLITGLLCLSIIIIVSITGLYFPDIVENMELLRPDISFPFIGILIFLCLSGSVIGLVFGFSGLLWRFLKR